jgi:integrase
MPLTFRPARHRAQREAPEMEQNAVRSGSGAGPKTKPARSDGAPLKMRVRGSGGSRSRKLSKSTVRPGRGPIILQPEAVIFFKLISKDRAADEPLLRRSDGARWNRSHQQRRMALALERAGLDKEGTFYALRHSYISRAIEGEVPLNIIGDNCGTSIRMIETTYAKVLAGKRREFIERGASSLGGA